MKFFKWLGIVLASTTMLYLLLITNVMIYWILWLLLEIP